MPSSLPQSAEHARLGEIQDEIFGWRRWGPYVSDRSWATVREDYSADGAAWEFLPHELARSKAYRWGEDAIAGICDRYQFLLFAPAFWNGLDPILKERLFGLTPGQANHGEDVKEYYFHLDQTPTHSFMRFLYKYPHRAYPYDELVQVNHERGPHEPEYELLDTGVFGEDRYFDIFIEYAKAGPEDLCIKIEAINRGPEPARLDILPHWWFRNRWAWHLPGGSEPVIHPGPARADAFVLVADAANLQMPTSIPVDYRLGKRFLYGQLEGRPLFTDNETNGPVVFGPGHVSRKPYVKDAFHRHVIHGEACVNPRLHGTKAALHYSFPAIAPGAAAVVRLRLSDQADLVKPLDEVDAIVAQRRREADEFYDSLHPPKATAEERRVQRQALAGLLWSKQSYLFNVDRWLNGDFPEIPPPASRKMLRNQHWRHLNSLRVMTVPDKWEYPWFAAWDLAFQCLPLALVDPAFAKDQLWVLLFEQFLHPSGQIPAYEWEFSDLNPPVHAWAVWRVYQIEGRKTGRFDREFLEKCFHKLLINFAWWTNKVDRSGNNLFEGGFLGLDNITVVDRSLRYPDGAILDQADATGWMAMFCLTMMRIAVELAKGNTVYEHLATKFLEHYVYIGHAMKHMGGREVQLWDERDGFFYDVLRYPDQRFRKFRVRSVVGLIPLFAVETLGAEELEAVPSFHGQLRWFLRNRPDLVEKVVHTISIGGHVQHVMTVVNQDQLRRILTRLWDPEEFLSPYGIRSLSKHHKDHPFELDGRVVAYEPAEATTKIKGGNSNWRGPLWFPINYLLIEALRKLGEAFGAAFRLDPPGVTLLEMANEIADRQIRLFTPDAAGRRPIHGEQKAFQDPHWRDCLLFHEYFHADTGQGLGACHQTGWTALVASMIDEWRHAGNC